MAKHAAGELSKRNSDHRSRMRSLHAREETFQTHAGIDDDWDRTDSKQRERRRDQRKALFHHDQGAITLPNTRGSKARGPGIGFCIELGERQREIVDPPRSERCLGAALRDFQCRVVRLTCGHVGKMTRNVGTGGRRHGAAGSGEWLRDAKRKRANGR
jgi:hypothetical protein